jgi:hypothetical protein
MEENPRKFVRVWEYKDAVGERFWDRSNLKKWASMKKEAGGGVPGLEAGKEAIEAEVEPDL